MPTAFDCFATRFGARQVITKENAGTMRSSTTHVWLRPHDMCRSTHPTFEWPSREVVTSTQHGQRQKCSDMRSTDEQLLP